MDVLGIHVETSMIRRWATWLAPTRQPFFLTPGEVVKFRFTPERPGRDLPAEFQDTYETWNLSEGLEVVWLDEPEFHAEPREVRVELVHAQVAHGRGAVPTVGAWSDLLDEQVLREQADGHRFVWWPTLIEARTDVVLERVVSAGHLPCRRTSVPVGIWRAAASTLPQARALSGTFANGGGANCFGTVMAASGVPGTAEACVPRELFEAWLADHCAVGGRDDLPGTVLVWRNSEGISTHAAATLGGGWALHKPGREWVSPRQVVTVQDLVRTAPPKVALHRYALPPAGPRTGLSGPH